MIDLQKLKDEVLDELITLTDEADLNPADKFDLLMTQYINSGDVQLLRKAYEAAQAIEDKTDKGNALMQLVSEIEIAQAEGQKQNTNNDNTTSETENLNSKDDTTINISVDKESKEA